MCGIVGVVNVANTEKTLISKLKLLEYRGYDSSGIAVKNGESITVTKATGEIKNLEKAYTPIKGASAGIAHTRWATHGKPTELNAHPHVSSNGDWAIVHNGIIENYENLKTGLETDYGFYSETDTETIAKLLERYQKGNSKDELLKTVTKTIKELEGSYALAIVNRFIDGIFFAKRKSPLYFAVKGEKFLLASDPVCFLNFSDEYCAVSDGEYGCFIGGRLTLFSSSGKEIKPVFCPLDVSAFDVETKYPHFMLKEISEEKYAFSRIYEYYGNRSVFDKLKRLDLKKINDIKIVGCGSAYHAGLLGTSMMENELLTDCKCYLASEFRYADPILSQNSLVILISQSGETADTLAALELAKQKNAHTLSIVNVEYSTLAKNSEFTFPTKAGAEISVASTKAFVSQIAVLYCISKYLAFAKRGVDYSIEGLKDVISFAEQKEHKLFKEIAGLLYKEKDIFMIGRGDDCHVAQEACLKIKETSYLNANAYFAGELKHGFIALIKDEIYVVVFATNENVLSKTLANAEETRARGAKLILVTNAKLTGEQKKKYYKIINVPKVEKSLQGIMSIIPWQLISYYMSVSNGLNPDKPRNLAKSVTVE